jgi:peptide/nickel transport system permease protein
MSIAAPAEPTAPPPPPSPASRKESATRSRGFWGETWVRFRRRKLAMLSLVFVCFMILVAIFAPAIAGTKPVVCYYKGEYYFPCLGYFVREWENPVFQKDRFRQLYPENLKKKDPESWAVFPLVYQDPFRRVRAKEWPDQAENPSGDQGKPSRLNWFGTDQRGVDVFAQMVHGTTIALLVGFLSMGIAAAIGIIFGAFAGYLGGWADVLMSRIIEVVQCIPTLILILAAIALLEKPNIWHMMVIIGLTGWTSIARLTRAEFIKLKQADFVTAAEAMGAGRIRVMFRHILPNALAPVLVPITFGIASAILIETSLSFLGFGSPPPNPSWGAVLDAGRTNPGGMWWLITFPGGAIFLAVLAYNLIGEGLQEATDPRLRGR